MDSQGIVSCARCDRFFVPRFRFQSADTDGGAVHYCSQTCREPALMGDEVACSVCGQAFAPTLAVHVQQHPEGHHHYFCGPSCRASGQPHTDAPLSGLACEPPHLDASHAASFAWIQAHTPQPPGAAPATVPDAASPGEFAFTTTKLVHGAPPPAPLPASAGSSQARVFAVLNQKGGTAKTITAVSVAAGLAALGHRTLLVDLDPQGNVAVCLGVQHPRTISHLLAGQSSFATCALAARKNLDVVLADASLAVTETALARQSAKERITCLTRAMAGVRGYDYVVIDCAPALSIVNENALLYAREVLIPVSCDYLALVGVKQVLRTLRRVSEQSGKTVRVAGVVPTFYDVGSALSLESLSYLRKTFGPRLLPPIRVSKALAEAPSKHQTIFEYAPDASGARDYIRVVEWLRSSRKIGTVGFAA